MASAGPPELDAAPGPAIADDPARQAGEGPGFDEVRERAAAGAVLMTARGGLILAAGLVGHLVLARLLVPRDFGLVSIGNVLIIVGRLLTDGGVGAGLIRRPRSPDLRELEAVQGLQLALTLALAGLFAAIAAPLGSSALVPALVAASLPITSLRLPQAMMFERQLNYRPIATVDVVEAVAFYAWAITAVALGLGVWGMASGFMARALAGTLTMIRLSPLGVVRPRWEWARVRPLLRFGLRFQAVAVGILVRDQGVNIGIATIAGLGTLGLWSFAYRILQIPYLLFSSLGRVSFPAMARIVRAGEDPRPLIERSIGVIGVVTGALTVGLVSAAPGLIPAAAGHRWSAVPPTLLWAGLALTIASPVAVSVTGYLFAVGDAGSVVRDVALQCIAWFAVTFVLLSTLGVTAAGVGWIAAALAEVGVLSRACARRSGARVLRSMVIPLSAAVPAGAAGWALGTSLPETLPTAVAAAVCGEAVLLTALLLLRPRLVRDTARLVARSVRASFAY